jgi:hypothetical protein
MFAKLDTYRKVGDPLARIFFQFRFYRLDLKEIKNTLTPESIKPEFERLLNIDSFLESYLKESTRYYNQQKNPILTSFLTHMKKGELL